MSSTDKNKQLVRRIYEEVINAGQMELLADFIADDYTGPGNQQGVAGFAGNIVALRNGFPDIRFVLDDLIAEDDRVVARWHWKATHNGPFAGFPASHRQVTNDGIAVYQMGDGKIIRSWVLTDRLGALQQMGVLPDNLGPKPQAASRK